MQARANFRDEFTWKPLSELPEHMQAEGLAMSSFMTR